MTGSSGSAALFVISVGVKLVGNGGERDVLVKVPVTWCLVDFRTMWRIRGHVRGQLQHCHDCIPTLCLGQVATLS